MYRPGRDQHLHDIVERVVRNGQEQQVGSFGHGRRLVDRGTRQQGLDAGPGRIRLTGDSGDAMACLVKRPREDGPTRPAPMDRL